MWALVLSFSMPTRRTPIAHLVSHWRLALSGFLFIWAFAIHFSFLRAVSDPVFAPDSLSYVLPALDRVLGRSLTLAETRAPLYSWFLYGLLKLTGGFSGVLIAQHLLSLGIGLLAGGFYYRRIFPSWVGAASVFFLTAALPIPVIYAHLILTETLYTSLFLGTLVLFFSSLDKNKSSLWLGTGLCAMLALLTRPAGYALIGGLTLALMVRPSPGRPKIKRASGAAGAGVLLVLIGATLTQAPANGSVTSPALAPLVFFSSTFRYLDPANVEDPSARSILQSTREAHPDKLNDFNWICYDPEGPVSQLAKRYTPAELSQKFRTWSVQAIGHQPFRFFWDRCAAVLDFFWSYSEIPSIYMNREYSFFVYRGLLLYGAAEAEHPGILPFLKHSPQTAQAYFDRLRQLQNKPTPEAEHALAELDRDDVYRYERVLQGWMPIKLFFPVVRWIPCLAMLASLLLWRVQRLRQVVITFWILMILHAGLNTLAGSEPRYAVPVTPLYWILLVAGIQTKSRPA